MILQSSLGSASWRLLEAHTDKDLPHGSDFFYDSTQLMIQFVSLGSRGGVGVFRFTSSQRLLSEERL